MPGILKSAGAIAVLFMVVACSGTPATTSTPVGGSPGATTGGTATIAPTIAPTTGLTAPPAGGSECAAFPTINPASPVIPSFAPDTALEAKFPAEIDGVPLRDLESGSYLQTLCLGGQAAVDRIRGQVQFDLLTLTFAQAEATVDGEDTQLQAFRAPGQDASVIIQTLIRVAQSGSTETIPPLVQATAGGKNVITTTDADGDTSYGYAVGDTLFLTDSITQSQADKIFAALP